MANWGTGAGTNKVSAIAINRGKAVEHDGVVARLVQPEFPAPHFGGFLPSKLTFCGWFTLLVNEPCLGGGDDKSISFTEDLDIAEGIRQRHD